MAIPHASQSPVPLRVLVVEDLRPIREALALVLTRSGYHVREADTFTGAAALLADTDILITDGTFPYRPDGPAGPWGLHLARLAQAAGQRVILLSGDLPLVTEALQAGVVAYSKPYSPHWLAQALTGEPPTPPR